MKRKLYKYEKVALGLVALGILFIIVSQMPGGDACFTDIFTGLGTGAVSGCALLLVSGKKETELYEKELMRGVSDEVNERMQELFLIQYDVSRDKVYRKKCIEVAAKVKGKNIDIEEWNEVINSKVVEINSKPISSKDEAETVYELVTNYYEQIKELKNICFDYNCKIKAEIKGIYKSYI